MPPVSAAPAAPALSPAAPPPPRPVDDPAPREPATVRLSEVLAALSRALDLTEGQAPGHTVRSCLIGMRMAGELGLGDADRSALYYALLLKDAGCSSNAARMSALFGADDRAVKPRMKLVDWHRPAALALETWRSAGRRVGGTHASLGERLRRFAELASTPDVTRDLVQVRCDRGAAIALGLGFPQATADAIRSLDEHWSGAGYPDGRRGDRIPLLARIANLAQCVESVHAAHGVDAALRVARARRGRWFDPILVDRLVEWRRDRAWWDALAGASHVDAAVVAAEPAGPADRALRVDDARLDEVARAFADIIDAKSPFTYHHSTNVAALAAGAARAAGLGPAAESMLHRAALLHDVGKLGVSSRILDKPGPLTPDERREVERHPVHSWDILSVVTAFHPFAWTAALHHERLNGSGYPWRLTAEQLDLPARILAVADVYEALAADRPYRAGLGPEHALGIVRGEVRAGRLCAEALDGLVTFLEQR
ncbi:MAG: HD domain-containing phosphohydrolase [Gemmatimonadaceae bacterium]